MLPAMKSGIPIRADAAFRLRWPDPETALAVLAGVMLTTAMPPLRWTGPLAVVALALLFSLLADARRPERTAWAFGLAHQTTLLYWLFFLDPAKSIPTRALVPIQASLAILYVSLFYLLLGWVLRGVRRRLGPGGALALLPVLWTMIETARGWGELGFPWCLSGSAWLGLPVERLAAVSGEIGLSAATAVAGAALVVVPRMLRSVPETAGAGFADGRGPERFLPILAIAMWSALAISVLVDNPLPDDQGDSSAPVPQRIVVAAVQAAVALDDKWDSARIDSTINPYTELTGVAAAAGAELVVWAETAVPVYLRYDAERIAWVRDLARENSVYLYTGFPDADRSASGELWRYNGSGLFSPAGVLIDRYAKHHLLPIGERMPFSRYFPFLARINVGQAEWQPGEPPSPLTIEVTAGSVSFAGLICYEVIFADLARQAVRRGSQMLVNITNDGWFGRTAGPRQHAEMTRLRAIECGVPVIRCANNGISFICDGRGRYLGWADLGERTVVMATVTPAVGRTLFVRAGAWPLAAILFAWTSLVVLTNGRRRS